MLNDLWLILFLVFLEGILSFDNALALATMVKHLPHDQQKKALTYGIIGAFCFRTVSLFFISFLMKAFWIKTIGGLYLLYLCATHFCSNEESFTVSATRNFWKTIVLVELTDIAFSIDSILASVAVSDKLWIVISGGILGIITMRFAANYFINIIDKFPRLTTTAYQMIGIVGVKLVLESVGDPVGIDWIHFEDKTSLIYWIFWMLMAISILYGFSIRNKTTIDQSLN